MSVMNDSHGWLLYLNNRLSRSIGLLFTLKLQKYRKSKDLDDQVFLIEVIKLVYANKTRKLKSPRTLGGSSIGWDFGMRRNNICRVYKIPHLKAHAFALLRRPSRSARGHIVRSH